jgi:hypothetical protein
MNKKITNKLKLHTWPVSMSSDTTCLYASWAKITGAYSSVTGTSVGPPSPWSRAIDFSDEYIFLMVQPCIFSNCSLSECKTFTAYATPLVSGLSNVVLSAYLANVACLEIKELLII